MARGRMINKKISNSRVVDELPEAAQLLYTWLIPHLDCNGCFYGSAQMIKSLVFPRKKYSKTRIENWIKLMENCYGTEKLPLIMRYFVDGEQYLFMPGFKGEQIGLRYDKERSEFPTFDGKDTETIGQNVPLRGREGEGEVEVKEGEGGMGETKEIIPKYKQLLSNVLEKNEMVLPKGYLQIILKWLRYKSEKGQNYKETGLKTFIKKFLQDTNNNADTARKMIDQSISNNWAGLFAIKETTTTQNKFKPKFIKDPNQGRFDLADDGYYYHCTSGDRYSE